jgi:hypothetical protein
MRAHCIHERVLRGMPWRYGSWLADIIQPCLCAVELEFYDQFRFGGRIIGGRGLFTACGQKTDK